MNRELVWQLAGWVARNAQGYTRQDGEKIFIEGKIDAYELLLYAQSLLAGRTTEEIHEANKQAYTGRAGSDQGNAVVEGADW